MNYIKSCSITKTEYEKMCQTNKEYFLLSDKIIAYINAKGFRKYFKE